MKFIFTVALSLLFASCASFQYKRGDAIYLGDETGIKDTMYFYAKLPFGVYQVYNNTNLDAANIDLYAVRSRWVIPTEVNVFDRRKIDLATSVKRKTTKTSSNL